MLPEEKVGPEPPKKQVVTSMWRSFAESPRTVSPTSFISEGPSAPGPEHRQSDATSEATPAENSLDDSLSPTSIERVFLRDLAMWADEYNETFHVGIFIREFIGQTLHHFLCFFSLPLLFLLYGSKAALSNRGFWYTSRDKRKVFMVQHLLSFPTTAVWILYFLLWPKERMETEFKFLIFVVLMRTTTISFKYANMTTNGWHRTNLQEVGHRCLSLMMLGVAWHEVPPRIMDLYMEISCVGILGTRTQRQRLVPRFVPWPQDINDLHVLRGRLDTTTKRLLLKPTGHISGRGLLAGSGPRRLVVERLPTPTSLEEEKCSYSEPQNSTRVPSDRGSTCASQSSPSSSGRSESHIRTNSNLATIWERDDVCPVKEYAHDRHISYYIHEHCTPDTAESKEIMRDEALIAAAGFGEAVPVEELFRFILRSLVRSEKVSCPRKAFTKGRHICGFIVAFAPLLIRCYKLKGFSELSWAYLVLQTVIGVPLWLMASYNILFVEIGTRDMWRRRALMRSCAALLTLSREWRRGCPVEVDQLPVLDMCDPRSIEAWRKLRQLCLDWGRFFYKRIQQFATSYCAFVGVMSADIMLSFTVPAYEKYFPVTMQKLVVFASIFATTGVSILLLAFFGNEVNDATYNHIALLQRHRMVLLSDQHIQAVEAEERGEEAKIDPKIECAVYQLEALCEDLEGYHAARPVRLLGLYCGYSLLTSLYFLPATLIVTAASFCSKEDTAWKCRSLG